VVEIRVLEESVDRFRGERANERERENERNLETNIIINYKSCTKEYREIGFNLPNKPDTYVLLHLVTSSARNPVLVSYITSAIVNMSRDEPWLVESKELVVRSWRFPKIARNFPISDASELFAPSPIIRPRIHRGAPLCARLDSGDLWPPLCKHEACATLGLGSDERAYACIKVMGALCTLKLVIVIPSSLFLFPRPPRGNKEGISAPAFAVRCRDFSSTF